MTTVCEACGRTFEYPATDVVVSTPLYPTWIPIGGKRPVKMVKCPCGWWAEIFADKGVDKPTESV